MIDDCGGPVKDEIHFFGRCVLFGGARGVAGAGRGSPPRVCRYGSVRNWTLPAWTLSILQEYLVYSGRMRDKTRLLLLFILGLLAVSGCVSGPDFDASEPLVAVTPLSDADRSERQVGVCFDKAGADSRRVVVPCSRRHVAELFALVSYPGGENEPYPGRAWLGAYAEDECFRQFETYTGRDYRSSQLGIIVRVPEEWEWAGGERDTACELYQPIGSSPLYTRIIGSRAKSPGLFPTRRAEHSPGTPPSPQARLIGNWMATDSASGAVFLVRFRQDGSLSILYFGNGDGAGGSYKWTGDAAIQLTFQSLSRGEQEAELCPRVPAFLAPVCRTSIIDPAAYPVPEQPSRAAPFDASEVAGPPYPAPSPAPVIASHIDEAFAVTLDEERLTLTHASGVTQDFQRLGQ